MAAARRAMIVVAHPDPSSFNHALADAIEACWAAAGLTVVRHDLYAEQFDPLLDLDEFRGNPTQSPQVQSHIAGLAEAELLGIVHPNCWGAPPAIMKGWIDRVFAPNSAYRFEKGVDLADVPQGLLSIRGALVVNTGNTPLAREREIFGDPLEAMWRRCILEYCRIARIERLLFGPLATSTGADRSAWTKKVRQRAAHLLIP